MELRPGYKRTEIGIIPSEWMLTHLGEIGSISAGGTPSRSKAKYWNGDIPWVTTSEVNFGTISEAGQSITRDGLANSAAKVLPRGTLVMALYGQGKTRGKVAILGIAAATNQACAAITLKPGVCREFVFHFLASQYHAIRNRSNTGNQENLNSSLVRVIPVALPPHSEQRAIAAALSDVDALLDGLTRLVARKRDLKHAAMHQLLTGRTRLPGFRGEWVQVALGELFTFKNGLNKAKKYFGVGTPIVNYMDVLPNTGIRSKDLRGLVTLSADEKAQFDVREGDVFFTRTSETREEIGMAAVMLDEPQQTVFSGFLLRARPRKKTLCTTFSGYCFRSSLVRNQIVSSASYTTRALTTGRSLAAVTLPLPSLSEQSAIATVLSDMDAELAALEARRAKTQALKQAMMQALLTGRIRLVAPEPAHA